MLNFIKKFFQKIEKPTTNNPYIYDAIGKKIWDDRYLNLSQEIKIWQKANFLLAIITLLLACAIIKYMAASSIKPYVVETTNGLPYAIKEVKGISLSDSRIANFAVNQFIKNVRTIVNDKNVQKALVKKVEAYSAGNIPQFLEKFYEERNPFDPKLGYNVDVKIINTTNIAKNIWQVIWEETKNGKDGETIETSRWTADITCKIGQINEKFLEENPFGIYIINLSWSKNLN